MLYARNSYDCSLKGLPEKIIPNDAKIQFACRNFLFELNATVFFFFFTAITLIINAMALYGNVFVASLIYSANPDCTIEVHPFSFAILVMGLSIWTASQWVITALRFVSIIIHFGKLDTVCNTKQ